MRKNQRASGVLIACGTALFGVGTALHPPTVSEADLGLAVTEGVTRLWTFDHWALMAAVLLLAAGLSGLHAALVDRGPADGSPMRTPGAVAASMGLVSAVLWVGLFGFEAAGWPVIAKAIAGEGAAGDVGSPAGTLPVTAQALWSAVLALGYVAGALLCAAIALWSVEILRKKAPWGYSGRFGLLGGFIGALCMPLAWSFPSFAFYFLVPVGAIVGVWLLLVSWGLWRGL